MPQHPLAEVFGFPANNLSEEAQRHRSLRLCPHNNRVPNCTKDKARDPLGVCSIFEGNGTPAITCPIRFRERWVIAEHAAEFFFPEAATWTSLTEVRLNDAHGRSAGNIDVVLVSYDEAGRLLDFGSVEVQAVYISGNVRRPFEKYMENPSENHDMVWKGAYPPRADYLSSSRKRLAPQLIYKGGILRAWEKKQAVVVHRGFWATLPPMVEVSPEAADIAWFIYDMMLDEATNLYRLTRFQTVYTEFRPALNSLTTPDPGPVETFIEVLQDKLDEQLNGDGSPPDAPTLSDVLDREA